MDKSADTFSFSSEKRIGFWCIFWIIVASVLLNLLLFLPHGISRSDWLILILPLALAATAYSVIPARVEGVVEEAGISFTQPSVQLDWKKICGVAVPDRRPKKPFAKNYLIIIYHEAGEIRIPRALNMSSERFLQAVLFRLHLPSGEPINEILKEYYRKHAETFGADRVFVFNALAERQDELNFARNMRRGAGVLFAAGLLVIGGSILVDGDAVETPFSVISGVWALGFAFLLLMASFANRQSAGHRRFRDSSLVVTPVGLALAQSDIKGELTWNQLLGVKEQPPKGSFQITSNVGKALLLEVEGVQIPVNDVYNFPLISIRDQITRYWRPEFQTSAFGEGS